MPTEPERPKRLSLSTIVEMLLTRGSDRSAVTLTRNAAGVVQTEVTARAAEDETIEDVSQKAQAVFDALNAKYAPPAAHDNAEVTLTRNAKGDTQIAIAGKTTESYPELGDLAEVVESAYDRIRMRFPMADGYTAKPGTIGARTRTKVSEPLTNEGGES